MIFRKAVLAAVFAFAATAAHAQFGVYGTFTVNQLSGIKSSPVLPPCFISVTQPICPTYDNSVNPIGGTGGVYYDFKKLSHVTLGADLRGSITTTKRGAQTDANGSGARLYSGLGGVRGVFHTPIHVLQPYIQASAGFGRSDFGLTRRNATGQVIMDTGFQWEGFAGLDIKLLPFMDFRAVELGYGGLDSGGHNYPVKTISSGVVFHLPF
jgi:hypothetical protein